MRFILCPCGSDCRLLVADTPRGAHVISRVRPRAEWLRAAAIAALAYGLCAWWLVPSYFRLTARNLAGGPTWQ